MIAKDISFSSPADNIHFDEVLLNMAEQGKGGEALRFWESQKPFIVLGRIADARRDVRMEEAGRDGIPVLRRCSGGGTVLQGRGCLNYTLILDKARHPALHDIRRSYRYILEKLSVLGKAAGREVFFRPVCDLAMGPDERKISGNAQKRGRRYILHHGTVLYNFDLEKIERYLAVPEDIPDYRRGRAHRDFLGNLPLCAGSVKKAVASVFTPLIWADELTADEKDGLDRSRIRREEEMLSDGN